MPSILGESGDTLWKRFSVPRNAPPSRNRYPTSRTVGGCWLLVVNQSLSLSNNSFDLAVAHAPLGAVPHLPLLWGGGGREPHLALRTTAGTGRIHNPWTEPSLKKTSTCTRPLGLDRTASKLSRRHKARPGNRSTAERRSNDSAARPTRRCCPLSTVWHASLHNILRCIAHRLGNWDRAWQV